MTRSELQQARVELSVYHDFFVQIDEAYDKSRDAEQVDEAVRAGLSRLKANLKQVKS